MNITPDELCRALHLASPALPIGSFSYSQGLETAVECGLVRNEAEADKWIADGLTNIIGRCDGPVTAFVHRAWRVGPSAFAEVRYWNSWFLASRESIELRRETEQMGWSLLRLAAELHWMGAQNPVSVLGAVAFPIAFGAAAAGLDLSETTTLNAFCFSWLEAQVPAAMKLVPLGQIAGHRILTRCRAMVPAVTNRALNATPEQVSSFAPMLGILSARHEHQYTRLFRS
ncbi:MAG: urease accessory protein UreF [Verrucomicrobia bacterium]|nr:urease accessory protein UreF [Verrucomicrobiota bacterium]